MLDLLFKQLGFNPADLKKQVDDAALKFNQVIDHFNNRLQKLEDQNYAILKLLGVDHVASNKKDANNVSTEIHQKFN